MKKIILPTIVIMVLLASMFTIQGQVAAETPTPYPAFPTATAYLPPEEGDTAQNTYTNDDYGFSITIPNNVEAENEADGSGTFQNYTIGGGSVFGFSYPTAMASGQSLQEVALAAYEEQAGYLYNPAILQDIEKPLNNGSSCWYTRFTAEIEEGDDPYEIRMYTIIHNNLASTFLFYSIPQNIKLFEKTIEKLVNSITFFSPTIMGYPRSQILILEGGETNNPIEYDPATTHGSGDYLIFEGLVTYDRDLEIMPALAAGWDVSPDATIYTFHLQPRAVFHNGKPVTAADVVYSWERAADPDTHSDTASTYLNDIVGVSEMLLGEADHISGLKVIDDHTLQVTIDSPKPYFLYKLTYPTANVVDRENIESGEDWYRTPNGTGPYRLTRWVSMEMMLYERYEDYYGEKPAIPAILYNLYSGDEFRMYEEGSVDIAGVPSYNIDRVTDPSEPLNKELVTSVSLCTYYVKFDVSKPPFDDVKVRQAFNLAFDKEKYIEVVGNNSSILAKGLYPPALPGYSLELQGYDFDPQRARELIAESSYGSVESFPVIVFTTSGYGSFSSSLASAMSEMWQQNLGVTISVKNIDPEIMLNKETEEEYGQLSSGGWCADYPDPQNFADVLLRTGAEMNDGHYSNPELDQILDQAAVEPDVDTRIALYQEAEQIIVEDAPYLFLFHGKNYELVKPYILGYVDAPVSTYPLFRYLSIDQDYWQ